MESGQDSQIAQGELLSDSGKRSTRETRDGSIVLDDQRSLDLLRSINLNGASCAGTNKNVTLDGCAISQSGGISSRVDGGG